MCDRENISSLNDEDVVLLAQDGNKYATENIILRYKNSVYAISSGYYMNGFDKEDIIQEGMIGLYRAIINYKPGKASFKTFAVLCITRKIVSVLKSAKRHKHIPLNSSLSLDNELFTDNEIQFINYFHELEKNNPEEIIISKENLLLYEEKIKNTLSKLELNVLSLHISGHTYKQISQLLNKDVKSVDNAVQRIKKKLQSNPEFNF